MTTTETETIRPKPALPDLRAWPLGREGDPEYDAAWHHNLAVHRQAWRQIRTSGISQRAAQKAACPFCLAVIQPGEGIVKLYPAAMLSSVEPASVATGRVPLSDGRVESVSKRAGWAHQECAVWANVTRVPTDVAARLSAEERRQIRGES